MLKTKKIISILTVLITLIFLVSNGGCKKDSSTSQSAGNPVFSVKLMDSPSGYDAVYVEIIGLEANLGNGWTPMALDNQGVYNLLSFTNGNSLSLMNDTVMAPCTIGELRLILGTHNTVVVAGITYELTTPSGQTSGYKVKMDALPLIAGGVYHLVLDFNAEKSIHQTGSGKYILQPVVKGYLQSTVGSIAGTISPVTGSYYCEATTATDTAGSYPNPATGQFLIPVVVPGTYSVTFFPNIGFSEKTVPGVVVVAGQTTQMGTINIE
jgi:hypothetical protein